MAIVKASFTKSSKAAKASIRYMQNRPGKDNEKKTRTLFGIDGLLGRWQAYHVIDEAAKGSFFYRFVMSPDPQAEDTQRDLHLREVTEKTMQSLADRFHTQISWVASEHDDHAAHRHVHVVAIIPGRLQVQDFQQMRLAATEAALLQRKERDLVSEQKAREQEGVQWELQP